MTMARRLRIGSAGMRNLRCQAHDAELSANQPPAQRSGHEAAQYSVVFHALQGSHPCIMNCVDPLRLKR
ncbi:MAG: hypothetical protein VX663_03085 [Pseudomonadota bacterium]|nr:hypothetical protein [Pseudomonadota bacterium]